MSVLSVVIVLRFVGVLAVSEHVGAEEEPPTGEHWNGRETFSLPGGYLGIRELGLATARDLLVTEEFDRLVIAGDDQVDFYSASGLQYLFSVLEMYDAATMRLEGDSLFVAARSDGVIHELDVRDGSVRKRWITNTSGLHGMDVSPSFVWFTHVPHPSGAGVSRIDRGTDEVASVVHPTSPGRETSIRVDRNDEETYYLSSNTSLDKFRWAEPFAEIPVFTAEPAGSGSFELSLNNAAIWTTGYGLYRFDTLDMTRSTDGYDTALTSQMISAEPSVNAHIVLGGFVQHKRVVQLFDRGVTRPRNEFANGHGLSQVAVSTERVFAISGDGTGTLSLDAWPLDYVAQGLTVTLRAEVNGDSDSDLADVELVCHTPTAITDKSYAQTRYPARFAYGTFYTFDIAPNHRRCDLVNRANNNLSVWIGLWTGSKWDYAESFHRSFDPLMQDLVVISLVFISPANDLALFVKQTYLDVLGREATDDEWFSAGSAIKNGEMSIEAFVVGLMDGEAKFEDRQARIARLYRAFFLRDSDGPGFDYWVGEAARGKSLFSISEFFSISPEFQLHYGSLDNRGFIRLVYQNVLGREPDGPGYAFWQLQVQDGMTRGELMTYFSDALEYRSYTSERVFVLYAARTLERQDPSEAKIEYLLNQFEADGKEEVVRTIVQGNGYFSRFWIEPPGNGAGLRLDDLSETCDFCDQVRWPELLIEKPAR